MQTAEKERYYLVDALRGLAVILMLVYHTLWDLIYIFGLRIAWFAGETGFVFQRIIRWMFVLISGFCCLLGGRKVKRGLITLGCSAVITLVTLVCLPDDPIHFGVLSLIGTATLLTAALEKPLRKINPWMGFLVCLVLFLLMAEAESGRLSFLGISLGETPRWLHRDMLTAFLGFPTVRFRSSDYVPLIPWLFSFWMGVFLYRILGTLGGLKLLSRPRIKALEYMGRYSLWIYMAHQPLIYGLLLGIDLVF